MTLLWLIQSLPIDLIKWAGPRCKWLFPETWCLGGAEGIFIHAFKLGAEPTQLVPTLGISEPNAHGLWHLFPAESLYDFFFGGGMIHDNEAYCSLMSKSTVFFIMLSSQ